MYQLLDCNWQYFQQLVGHLVRPRRLAAAEGLVVCKEHLLVSYVVCQPPACAVCACGVCFKLEGVQPLFAFVAPWVVAGRFLWQVLSILYTAWGAQQGAVEVFQHLLHFLRCLGGGACGRVYDCGQLLLGFSRPKCEGMGLLGGLLEQHVHVACGVLPVQRPVLFLQRTLVCNRPGADACQLLCQQFTFFGLATVMVARQWVFIGPALPQLLLPGLLLFRAAGCLPGCPACWVCRLCLCACLCCFLLELLGDECSNLGERVIPAVLQLVCESSARFYCSQVAFPEFALGLGRMVDSRRVGDCCSACGECQVVSSFD